MSTLPLSEILWPTAHAAHFPINLSKSEGSVREHQSPLIHLKTADISTGFFNTFKGYIKTIRGVGTNVKVALLVTNPPVANFILFGELTFTFVLN